MLILNRRINENIIILNKEDHSCIKVAILGIHGCQTRVGLEAPFSYSIDRQEIFEKKMHKQNLPNLYGEKNGNDFIFYGQK